MTSIVKISSVLYVKAFCVEIKLRLVRRNPSGSREAAWSVPFHVRLSVKCLSMTEAPRV